MNPLQAGNPGDMLYRRPAPEQQTRWFTFENRGGRQGAAGQANFGRKGSPATTLKPGETFVLVDVDGPGTIRRIWTTIDPQKPETLRGLRLEMFWEGAKTPAVQAPAGDFFGHSLGRMVRFENALFSSPENKSFNCLVPMPFRKHARVQVTNETDLDIVFFYEYDLTLGDRHGDDMLYFHAHWRRENPTELRRDMTILPRIEGCGRFLGCLLGMRQNPATSNFWWGEGEVKIYLDGDTELPTLCGTGTEDYIGTGWGQHVFDTMFQGCPYAAEKGEPGTRDAYAFYRLHVPDPVYFHNDIRVTIQTLGGANGDLMLKCLERDPSLKFMKAGDGSKTFTREELEAMREEFVLVERQDDYCAAAYWYLDQPENGLPQLQPVAERVADLSW